MSVENIQSQYELLLWDTKAFRYPVYRMAIVGADSEKLKGVLNALSSKRARLVYWYVDPADDRSNLVARNNGGFLADRKVTFEAEIPPAYTKGNNIASVFGQVLTPRLKRLALEAGASSRYKVDPNFVSGEFEYLYTEWIRKSLNGEMADEVLVYVESGREVGFITLRNSNKRASIGLIAVDLTHRGKGIGANLVKAGFVWASARGFSEADVVTQMANSRACNFYQKCGFKEKSVVNVYHFWL